MSLVGRRSGVSGISVLSVVSILLLTCAGVMKCWLLRMTWRFVFINLRFVVVSVGLS